MSTPIYYVTNWPWHEPKSAARDKRVRRFRWVAVKVDFAGDGWIALRSHAHMTEALGVWQCVLGLALLSPYRGLLLAAPVAGNCTPMTAGFISARVGLSKRVIERGLSALSSPDVQWLRSAECDGDYDKLSRDLWGQVFSDSPVENTGTFAGVPTSTQPNQTIPGPYLTPHTPQAPSRGADQAVPPAPAKETAGQDAPSVGLGGLGTETEWTTELLAQIVSRLRGLKTQDAANSRFKAKLLLRPPVVVLAHVLELNAATKLRNPASVLFARCRDGREPQTQFYNEAKRQLYTRASGG